MNEVPCTVHVALGETDDADAVTAMLFGAGASGVERRDATTIARADRSAVELVAYFEGPQPAHAAATILIARWPSRVVELPNEDWRESWKRFFAPAKIGERVVVRPSWEPYDRRDQEIVIIIDPGQAFGTGTHETTTLVVRELESLPLADARVLDVGCGTGILAIVALRLGAARAHCTDIDPLALDAANQNAYHNDVGDRLIVRGSDLGAIEENFDVVMANIRTDALVAMADDLVARTRAGATLIVSGIFGDETDRARAAFDPRLSFVRGTVDGDWSCLRYRRGVR